MDIKQENTGSGFTLNLFIYFIRFFFLTCTANGGKTLFGGGMGWINCNIIMVPICQTDNC